MLGKIDEYNQKKSLTGKAKTATLDLSQEKAKFKPIRISENGLELIEWISLDCTNAEGAWHSDTELKIDKKGYVTKDGAKTKDFWDAKITGAVKPLRLRIRNIAGDESIVAVE